VKQQSRWAQRLFGYEGDQTVTAGHYKLGDAATTTGTNICVTDAHQIALTGLPGSQGPGKVPIDASQIFRRLISSAM
jgi:hypothetical protein